MEALILAGGLGQRLRSVVPDLPKPMALVQGRPFLEYTLRNLEIAGYKKIILSVGYKQEIIHSYFGEQFGQAKLVYSCELQPLGTGGAIRNSMSQIEQPEILILNGDTYCQFNFKDISLSHQKTGADITLTLKYVENIGRYGTVILEGNRISRFEDHGLNPEPGFINCGAYILKSEILNQLPKISSFSFESQFLKQKTSSLLMNGFVTDGFFIDIGVPDDFRQAQSSRFLESI